MKKLIILFTTLIMSTFLSCQYEDPIPGNEYNKIQSTNACNSTYSLLCGGNTGEKVCCKTWLKNDENWTLTFYNSGIVKEKYNGDFAVAIWQLNESEFPREITFEYIISPDTWNDKSLYVKQISQYNLELENEIKTLLPFTANCPQ